MTKLIELHVPVQKKCAVNFLDTGCYVLMKEHFGESHKPLNFFGSFMKKNVVDLGEAQARGRLWEEYFADPSQSWDNRLDKVSSGVFNLHF